MDESTTISNEYWRETSKRLQEPFDPQDVDFRVQGKVNEQTGRGQVVAYIDARAVQDRLDAVVGAGNWSFDWQPLVIDNGEVMIAKGTLTILGVAKSDAGTASTFEQSLGAVSHCFKRAAVHWGIGRYLYNLSATWVQVEKGGRIPEPVLRDLRSRLPRPQTSSRPPEMDEGERVVDSPVDRHPPVRPGRPMTAAPTPSASAHVAPVSGPRELPTVPPSQATGDEPMATEKQVASIRKLCEALGKPEPNPEMTYSRARELITQLSGEYQRARRAS